jgi:sugar/nucleoside kinase (ribokinase family)
LVVGDVMDDIVVRPLGAPLHGGDTFSRIERHHGGSAANQAAWLSSCGVDVTFVGRLAAGDVERHRAALAGHGVRPELVADPDRPTGVIVVLVDADGERSMYTDRGANTRLVESDLPAGLLDDASLLLLSGYSLFDPVTRGSVLRFVRVARDRGVPFAVDPASTAVLDEIRPETFLHSVDGAVVIFPNLDEGRLLTGASDPGDVAAVLLRRFDVVALKLGPDGALVCDRAGVSEYVEAVRGPVLDTTGAGDAFCAGFLAAWLLDGDVARAGHQGVRVAAEVVGRVGGRPPEPGEG